jgi:alkyldihydroxyacetonephosphate synthase
LWRLPALPASAAGPDLRQVLLGSEGRLGIITRATLRIWPRPARDSFHAVFFPDWASGTRAVQSIAQAGVGVSMLRLADPVETATTLALSGKEHMVGLAERGLGLAGYGPERCLLIFGVIGPRDESWRAYHHAVEIARHYRGLVVNVVIGEMWRKTRFLTPYLRNTLWERGYALDTLETALPWSRLLPALEEIKAGLRSALEDRGEKVLAFSHLSHVYPVGSSLYVTYLWRRAQDPAETLDRWKVLKAGASQTIVRHGGTISHQHGVGTDHAPYLEAEKGALGLEAIRALCHTFDPEGMMNPGKLV